MIDNRAEYFRCKCHDARKAISQMRKAGVDADKTFDNYEATQDWQRRAVATAKAFLNTRGAWLYAGGQVGSGKTHICTAVVNEFINRGYQCAYMLWREDGTKLKACINDSEQYAAMLDRFKNAQVLYIDDFLKTRPNESPTAGDLNLAFELLNYRYSKKMTTIISCERMTTEIELLDEAVGSRICERSRGYCLNIKRERERNYRMKGEVI